jgi:hypothetical protein
MMTLSQLDRVRVIQGPHAGHVGVVMRVSAKGSRITVVIGDGSTSWWPIVCKPEELELLDRVPK